MGTDPVLLDDSWFSAQHRARLFWGNIPGLGKTVIPEVNIKLQDCLLPNMNRRAVVDKIRTATIKASYLHQGKSHYTCNSTLFFFLVSATSHIETWLSQQFSSIQGGLGIVPTISSSSLLGPVRYKPRKHRSLKAYCATLIMCFSTDSVALIL
jgi:hypothetical protein